MRYTIGAYFAYGPGKCISTKVCARQMECCRDKERGAYIVQLSWNGEVQIGEFQKESDAMRAFDLFSLCVLGEDGRTANDKYLLLFFLFERKKKVNDKTPVKKRGESTCFRT